MDDIKDSSKGDDFSRFVDAQNVRTDPFGRNRAAERLYRRAERIGAALYLLTRHIPESEPLRSQVRMETISLFGKILQLRDEMRAAESETILAFEASIRRLISLVRLLTAAGFLSFQNAEIIIGALDELGAYMTSAQRSSLSEGISLTRENIVGDTSPLGSRQFLKDIKDRKDVKDNLSVTPGQSGPSAKISSAARSQGILAILQAGGGLGIKEIASRLPDYSEKMIQRELALLVSVGRVKKDGFKRWSRYSLA
ncbi:MAG TPA: hypothetical protein VMH91_00435 [Candidatus Paceibacterota bacterium]|nr:hypothetical protein [Candidatus Paceibacterota bacterium]